MKMPGQDAESLELLRKLLQESEIPAEKKKMFGHETYFLKGYMFTGVYDADIFVHVGFGKVEASQGLGLGFFEPMGKRMRSYLTLPKSMQNAETIKTWLIVGATYLTSLPAKKSTKVSGKAKAEASKKSPVKVKPKKTSITKKSAQKNSLV